MPHLQSTAAAKALNQLYVSPDFVDHREARARNRLHIDRAPPRVIEIGEVTAGIAVPEQGGVRFFSSARDFDRLDGTVFRSVEQAAKAAREHFTDLTRLAQRPGHRTRGVALRIV